MQRKPLFLLIASVVMLALVAQVSPTQSRPVDAASISVGWSSVSDGLPGRVFTMLQADPAAPISALNPLYVGGMFTNVGGDADADLIVKWDGTSWSKVTTTALTPRSTPYVGTIAKSGTDLYVGGVFTASAGSNNIAKIDSSGAVSAILKGVSGGLYDSDVEEIAVVGSDVYVGGVFGQVLDASSAAVTNTAGLAKWNGTAWSAVGSGLDGISPTSAKAVNGLLAASSTELYVGGQFLTAGGVPDTSKVAKLTSSTWSRLGEGFTSGLVATFAKSGTDIYAGGNFTTTGATTVNGIAKWNGTAWSALGSGVSGGGAVVEALAVDASGNLWAGGNFTSVGGVAANNIARWNGSSWSPIVCGDFNGVNGTVRAIAPQSDGSIIAAGFFTSAGGKSGTTYLARYTPGSENCLKSAPGLDAPQNARVEDFTESGDIVIAWEPPANSGSFQILGYRVESEDGFVRCFTGALSCVIPLSSVPNVAWGGTVLNTDQARLAYMAEMALKPWNFSVRATNGDGWGMGRLTRALDGTKYPPLAPRSITVKGGFRQVEVSWPAATSRFPIVEYRVLARPGNIVCASQTTSCTYNNSRLKPGQKYSFRVYSISRAPSVGTSPAVAAEFFDLRLNEPKGKRNLLGTTVSVGGAAPGVERSAVRLAWRENGKKWNVVQPGKALTVGENGKVSWSRFFVRSLRGKTIEVRLQARGETSDVVSIRIP